MLFRGRNILLRKARKGRSQGSVEGLRATGKLGKMTELMRQSRGYFEDYSPFLSSEQCSLSSLTNLNCSVRERATESLRTHGFLYITWEVDGTSSDSETKNTGFINLDSPLHKLKTPYPIHNLKSAFINYKSRFINCKSLVQKLQIPDSELQIPDSETKILASETEFAVS